jgi:phosphoglycerate dehydrogenase-like enzyme
MRPFRIAITGDFLNADGQSAYGDLGYGALDACPYVEYHFILDHAPRPDDSAYWERLYSMEVKAEHIANADALLVLRPYVKSHVFANGAGDLTFVGRSGNGYDKIDVKTLTENDVALFNLPSVLTHSTAASALMFILALAKQLMPQDRVTRQGRWDLQPQVLGMEIEGKTLGIIGLGASGRELVRLAAPFHMNVIAYSPHADPAQAWALNVRLASLEEVMGDSDFVSVHSNLTPEKRQMIRAEHLALMKPTAYFINVARGVLVDQAALVKALQERKIAGAGLDVFEVEPLPADDPLTRLDNVLLTPHWSPATSDVWTAGGREMSRLMLQAAQGDVPETVVNKEVLTRPRFRDKLARFAENKVERDPTPGPSPNSGRGE